MKKPLVLLDLSIYLEALLSVGSDSSRLVRRWLDNDEFDVLTTARCLRALEGAVLDPEFLDASKLEAQAAERWVAALALRVETVDAEAIELRRNQAEDLAELSEKLTSLDLDSVLAARYAHALVISSDPLLLGAEDLGVEVLPPTSLLSLLDAL